MVEGLVGRDNHSEDEAKSVFVSPSWWHSMWYVAYCRQVNSLYDWLFIYLYKHWQFAYFTWWFVLQLKFYQNGMMSLWKTLFLWWDETHNPPSSNGIKSVPDWASSFLVELHMRLCVLVEISFLEVTRTHYCFVDCISQNASNCWNCAIIWGHTGQAISCKPLSERVVVDII